MGLTVEQILNLVYVGADGALKVTGLTLSGGITVNALTDAELRASRVPVNLAATDPGVLAIIAEITARAGLTDTQLRASRVPVNLAATDAGVAAIVAEIIARAGLTDTQLRATPIKVDDDATQTALDGIRTTIDDGIAVTGPVTDAQLRATPLPVSLGVDEDHLGSVGGKLAVVSVEFTRPADTTAYAANDAVADLTAGATILTFANAARVAAGSGYITGARVMTDQKANVAQFRLHLFHTSVTALADNAVYTLLWGNRTARIGTIDLPAMSTEDAGGSTGAEAAWFDLRVPFVCDSGVVAIFGMLETKTAFTPASGQKFYVELTIDQN